MEENCPFCNLLSDRKIILENAFAFSIFDKFPVSPGHTLVIPKRHIDNYFLLTEPEQSNCWKLVNEMQIILTKDFRPDSFNIGVNIGEAAGQTIFHAHIHLIPRFKGDVEVARGGVRGVIAGKQNY